MHWASVIFGLGLLLVVAGFVILNAQNDRLAAHQAAEDRLLNGLKTLLQSRQSSGPSTGSKPTN
jgi:hypothetical protein